MLMDTSEMDKLNQTSSLNSTFSTILSYVFEDYYKKMQPQFSMDKPDTVVPFQEVWKSICRLLDEEIEKIKETVSWNSGFRIGGSTVHFNKTKVVGAFEFKDDHLEICSKDSFSTIYADTCVYKGKWQYELLLGSKEVMQLGWATLNCDFSHEYGVGDTANSYAYDGNRQRKWNVATHKFGEAWQTGDVISCTIDLDQGTISYFRNGRSMGVAFSDVRRGAGVAYFPALSLAMDEIVTANFGGAPFSYPVEGYEPLQAPPLSALHAARVAVRWCDKLALIANRPSKEFTSEKKAKARVAVCANAAQRISALLAPLLALPYVVEDCLLPLLERHAEAATNDSASEAGRRAISFIKFIYGVLQPTSQLRALDCLLMRLQRRMRHVALSFEYRDQKACLRVLKLLVSHRPIRIMCIDNHLLNKERNVRLISFLCVRCIDQFHFEHSADIDFWSAKDGSFCHGDRQSFNEAVRVVKRAVREVEELQTNFLLQLFECEDAVAFGDTSRARFLSRLRIFIENVANSRTYTGGSPWEMLSLYWACVRVSVRAWGSTEIGEASIPPHMFYKEKMYSYDVQRLGGLELHLRKKFAAELQIALRHDTDDDDERLLESSMDASEGASAVAHCSSTPQAGWAGGKSTTTPEPVATSSGQLLAAAGLDSSTGEATKDVSQTGGSERSRAEAKRKTLLQLLDSCVLLYMSGAHKCAEKVAAAEDEFFEHVSHWHELVRRRERAAQEPSPSDSIVTELNSSIEVMETTLRSRSFRHAWNAATVMSRDACAGTMRMLKVVLGALKSSSKKQCLFGFVPDFYVETMTQLCQDLVRLILYDQKHKRGEVIRLFYPGGAEVEKSLSQDYYGLLVDVGEFVANHFCDARIVFADSKDTLVQALAGFVCHRPSLEALERMPPQSRAQMVRHLLQPYENRAWAQNNWILVRFWKGLGFGFRFTRSPHLKNKLGPKPAHSEVNNVIQSAPPYYSSVFVAAVTEALRVHDVATPFLNSLLNQLNWVFSEFIGMLQEIQNASNRPERVFIDSRQLRICATCFDLGLALLRVIELAVAAAPHLFIDRDSRDARALLTRLCQLLCQVLNRVSVWSGCFAYVVSLEIPGLEAIHQFPILTAVAGILVALLKRDVYHSRIGPGGACVLTQDCATRKLLAEASFQMSSLYPLVGGHSCIQDHCQWVHPVPLILGNRDSPWSPIPPPDPSAKIPCPEPSDSDFPPFQHSFAICQPMHAEFFTLTNYSDDVNTVELHQLVDVVCHLQLVSEAEAAAASAARRADSASPTDDGDDGACTICYAASADALFQPCGHTSCATCITHHLMNQSLCFFCKAKIAVVTDAASNVIFTAEAEQD